MKLAAEHWEYVLYVYIKMEPTGIISIINSPPVKVSSQTVELPCSE